MISFFGCFSVFSIVCKAKFITFEHGTQPFKVAVEDPWSDACCCGEDFLVWLSLSYIARGMAFDGACVGADCFGGYAPA